MVKDGTDGLELFPGFEKKLKCANELCWVSKVGVKERFPSFDFFWIIHNETTITNLI